MFCDPSSFLVKENVSLTIGMTQMGDVHDCMLVRMLTSPHKMMP